LKLLLFLFLLVFTLFWYHLFPVILTRKRKNWNRQTNKADYTSWNSNFRYSITTSSQLKR
jgi:hypothetical protein